MLIRFGPHAFWCSPAGSLEASDFSGVSGLNIFDPNTGNKDNRRLSQQRLSTAHVPLNNQPRTFPLVIGCRLRLGRAPEKAYTFVNSQTTLESARRAAAKGFRELLTLRALARRDGQAQSEREKRLAKFLVPCCMAQECKDSPLVTRYPGSTFRGCDDSADRIVSLPMGPGKPVPQSRRSRIVMCRSVTSTLGVKHIARTFAQVTLHPINTKKALTSVKWSRRHCSPKFPMLEHQ